MDIIQCRKLEHFSVAGNKMLDTGREALKDIAKIHIPTPVEEVDDPNIDPNPKPDFDTNKLKTASIDEDDSGTTPPPEEGNEFDKEKIREDLRERGWEKEGEEGGPEEYYNEETGETIIVNPDSEVDLEISYKPDGEEITLQMLMEENPDGGADVYAYYNVWIKKEETKELIHEEKMRMKYEYLIEEVEQEIGEKPHNFRFGSWQRTSVEVSFNYSPAYEAGELEYRSGDAVWDYHEIGNNNATTLWKFYYNQILFSLESFDNENKTLHYDENIDKPYFLYENIYYENSRKKEYSPQAYEDYYGNPLNEFLEEDFYLIYIFLSIDSNGNLVENEIFKEKIVQKDETGIFFVKITITGNDGTKYGWSKYISIKYNSNDSSKHSSKHAAVNDGGMYVRYTFKLLPDGRYEVLDDETGALLGYYDPTTGYIYHPNDPDLIIGSVKPSSDVDLADDISGEPILDAEINGNEETVMYWDQDMQDEWDNDDYDEDNCDCDCEASSVEILIETTTTFVPVPWWVWVMSWFKSSSSEGD